MADDNRPIVHSQEDWSGNEGNERHTTRRIYGLLPIDRVRNMQGQMDEVPGEHRNMQGQDWEDFKSDIAENGIKHGIYIRHLPGKPLRIWEGNHRRDAAVELGMTHVPVEVQYQGHTEHQDRLFHDRRPDA